MKIVLDYIPNHSSDQHEWFLKSVAREDPYTDYYVWVDPKGMDEDGNPIPPNNWVSRYVTQIVNVWILNDFFVAA